jgi:hypothetical protein
MKRAIVTKAKRGLTKSIKKATHNKTSTSKKRNTVVARYIKDHEKAYSKLAEIDRNSLKSAKLIVEKLLAKR